MHQEKSVRCPFVLYKTALCKASLKIATMERNISGILNVMRNFIPDPLCKLICTAFIPASMKIVGRQYALCSHDLYNTVHWFLLKISLQLACNIYWLTDHILSSLFNKCSVLLGTGQHLSKVPGGKHSLRLKKVSALLHFMKGNLSALSDIAL